MTPDPEERVTESNKKYNSKSIEKLVQNKANNTVNKEIMGKKFTEDQAA